MSETTSCNTKPIYILHIEDDDGIIRAVQRLLVGVFPTAIVTSAKSADEVAAVVGRYPWAAIISDWRIQGGMNGGDVYKMIRISHPELVSKYIFLADSQMAKLLAAAVDVPFVEKPGSPETIYDALHKVFGTEPRVERGLENSP